MFKLPWIKKSLLISTSSAGTSSGATGSGVASSSGGFWGHVLSFIPGLFGSAIAFLLFFILISLPLLVVGGLTHAFGFLFGQPFLNFMLTGQSSQNINIFLQNFHFSFQSPLGELLKITLLYSILFLVLLFTIFMIKISFTKNKIKEEEISLRVAYLSRAKWFFVWCLIILWVPLFYFLMVIIVNGLTIFTQIILGGGSTNLVSSVPLTATQFANAKTEVLNALEQIQKSNFIFGTVTSQNSQYQQILSESNGATSLLLQSLLKQYNIFKTNFPNSADLTAMINQIQALGFKDAASNALIANYNNLLIGAGSVNGIVDTYNSMLNHVDTIDRYKEIGTLFNIDNFKTLHNPLENFTNGSFNQSIAPGLTFQNAIGIPPGNGAFSNTPFSVMMYQLETGSNGTNIYHIPSGMGWAMEPFNVFDFTSRYPFQVFGTLIIGAFINFGILKMIIQFCFILLGRIAKLVWFVALASLYTIYAIWDNGTLFKEVMLEILHAFYSIIIFCFVWNIFLQIVVPAGKLMGTLINNAKFTGSGGSVASTIMPAIIVGIFVISLLYESRDIYKKLLTSVSQGKFNIDSAVINANSARSHMKQTNSGINKRMGKAGGTTSKAAKDFGARQSAKSAGVQKQFGDHLNSEAGKASGFQSKHNIDNYGQKSKNPNYNKNTNRAIFNGWKNDTIKSGQQSAKASSNAASNVHPVAKVGVKAASGLVKGVSSVWKILK